MPTTQLNKKTLKEQINKNGFYLKMQTNIINHDELQTLLDTEFTETNAVRTGKVAPKGENIIIFKGLASQKYGKGEKNRNGYRIEPKGWKLENYVLNPIILLQHKADLGGI
jgi:hypothetical protein